MTIREYAEDVNRSVEDIVKHMESLSMDIRIESLVMMR